MPPTRIALALLIALSIPSWSRLSLAESPPAEFTIEFDGAAAIWNPFEDFLACETVTEGGLSAQGCLSLDNVFCDGAGNCTCSAAFELDGDVDGLLTGPCTAKVSCKATDDPDKPVCKASLELDASGSVEICDASVENFVVKGPVDSTGLYHGKAKTKVCVDCGAVGGPRECLGFAGSFEYPVNPPIPWQLTVELAAPDPKKPNNLVGAATDDVGPFDYTAKGKYNPKNDETTITLKGVTRKADPGSVSQGAKVKLEKLGCEAGQCTGGTADIKVQGNKINNAPIGP